MERPSRTVDTIAGFSLALMGLAFILVFLFLTAVIAFPAVGLNAPGLSFYQLIIAFLLVAGAVIIGATLGGAAWIFLMRGMISHSTRERWRNELEQDEGLGKFNRSLRRLVGKLLT